MKFSLCTGNFWKVYYGSYKQLCKEELMADLSMVERKISQTYKAAELA